MALAASKAAARAVAALSVALFAMAGHAQSSVEGTAEPPTLRLSTAPGPAYPRGQAGARWAELVNAGASGRFVVKHFPGATLAGRDATKELAAMREGKIDLAVGSALEWSQDVPALAVYALPWLAATPRALDALMASERLDAAIAARVAAAGAVVVAIAPLWHHVVATANRAVIAPADCKGLRLRASATPLVVDTLRELGATPVAMSFADAEAAFVSGKLDGQDGRAAAFAATRIIAFGQKRVTRWGAFGDAMIFVVRKAVWESWTDPERATVRDAARRAAEESGAATRDEAALDELARSGVDVVRLSAAGRQAFRAATQAVFDRYAAKVGSDVVDAARDALASVPATER